MIGRWLRSRRADAVPQPVATMQPPPDPAPLARFAATFAMPDFVFGTWQGGTAAEGVVQAHYLELSPDAAGFVAAAYAGHWVRPEVRWSDFAAGEAYRRLRSDPAAVAVADVDQLACLLTALIRGDRFNEGLLASAFDDGTLPAIARRMAVLADQSSRRSVAGSRSPA